MTIFSSASRVLHFLQSLEKRNSGVLLYQHIQCLDHMLVISLDKSFHPSVAIAYKLCVCMYNLYVSCFMPHHPHPPVK